MRISSFFLSVSVSLAILGTAVPAQAAAKLEGKYTDWKVYSKTEGGDKICYVLGQPKSMAPKTVRHGDIFFMVANWKSGAAKEQPSLLTGYDLKTERPPSARVGSSKIPMYAADNEAFVESNSDEKKLVRAMKKGAVMRVDAVSARGTQTSYEFSLKGITAALGKARKSCGN